ncbi:hypothetical protein THAOC_19657, partial [Thalassiosira oceanica]
MSQQSQSSSDTSTLLSDEFLSSLSHDEFSDAVRPRAPSSIPSGKIIAAGKFVTRNGNVTSDSVGSCAPALDADASTSFDGGCSQSAPSCDEPGDGDLRSTALCLGGRNFPTPNLGGIQLARFESARLMGTSLRLGKVANPGLPEVTTRSMVVGSTPPGPGPLPPTHGHCGRPISRPGVPMG